MAIFGFFTTPRLVSTSTWSVKIGFRTISTHRFGQDARAACMSIRRRLVHGPVVAPAILDLVR